MHIFLYSEILTLLSTLNAANIKQLLYNVKDIKLQLENIQLQYIAKRKVENARY